MAIAADKPSPGAAAPGHQAPFARVAPVVGTALVLGASAGFVLATVLTLTMSLGVRTGAWWVALAQAHGHTQLYGWAGLFVVGVALHFVPRLRGAPLAHSGAVPALLAALVAGLVLRILAQPLAAWTGAAFWRWLLPVSGALEAVALVGFVVLVAATLRRGPPLRTRPALTSILPFVACAWLALALAALTNLVNLASLAGPLSAGLPAGLVPSAGDNLNVALGLFGFLVPMALAMSARSLPMYAGLTAFPQHILWPLAWAYIAGLALLLIGTLAPTWTAAGGAGMVLLGGALIAFVATFLRLMRSRGKLPQRVARLAPTPNAAARAYEARVARERRTYGPFVGLIASAYAWAAFGGLLLLLDGIAALVGAPPLASVDAARHSLAAGFIALLLCGVAPRLIPGFSGGQIRAAWLVSATLWLGNGAALLRVGAVLLAPLLAGWGAFGLSLDRALFGLSGPLGLALAICLAVNLWPALWPPLPRDDAPSVES